ncbi:hypothetical protein [Paenibacillus sp. FSL L8-0708]|uniref:hypothetical protein n=1 Tax=Paenibacillus sp. FSL L8-0708 TaxID=2975311 RepID=UPI0030FC232C
MYFITKEADLLGKTIAFTNMSQFAEAITIATEDGGIIVLKMEYSGDGESTEINIYGEVYARQYILNDTRLRADLLKSGALTEEAINEYEFQREVVRQQWAEGQEERRRREYERMKAEFEPDLNK